LQLHLPLQLHSFLGHFVLIQPVFLTQQFVPTAT
jgi:hypothetical protein